MGQLTISEALSWLKTLKDRHGELVQLRKENSNRETRFYGAHADKQVEKEPTYDVKALDALVTRVAREIRVVEIAIKKTNAATVIEGYDQNDDVLGQVT